MSTFTYLDSLPDATALKIHINLRQNLASDIPSKLALSRFLSACFSNVRQKSQMYSNRFLWYSGIAANTWITGRQNRLDKC